MPALISTLRHGAPRVRPDAAWALGEICDPRAVVPLSAAMIKGEADLRIAATAAMAEIAKEYQDPGCLEPLINRLTDVPEVRREAAWGLNFLHGPRSCEPLRDALFFPDVEGPIMDFTGKPEKVQDAVAAALAGLDDDRSADAFVRVLDDDQSSAKLAAMVGLARLRDSRVLPYWNRYWKGFARAITIAGREYKAEGPRGRGSAG